MIKKLLLIAAFVLPLFSDSYVRHIHEVAPHNSGKYMIATKIGFGHPGGDTYETNWIGVYQKGASNDWENVLKWSWAKDLEKCDRMYGCINIADLGDGEYDIRYFRQ